MYTAIAQTRNINIEGFSQLLKTIRTEKRSYPYNKFLLFVATNISTLYIEVQPLHLAYLTGVFLMSSPTDIIMTQVLAVGIPHGEATT